MDELLHHCLRELSFDGDLGCDVSRLGVFVTGFYAQNPLRSQKVDEAFHAFFWSVLVQQPTVRVGTLPPGAATEVYVAPQAGLKRKAKTKGEEIVEDVASALDIIPDAQNRSLDSLKREYGDALRVAVDPDTSFAAITGSHIRSSKLSPMVYTALQFVTRGRENGISLVDLGKKTKYDQKACFYLVKQLVDLGLVEKVRRGGVGSHFCIHKYFYERSSIWQTIRDEEMRAETIQETPQGTPPLDPTSTVTSTPVKFDPMDARHLSSLPLVRARIVKLLKGAKNHMHPCNNILLTLGFSNPTKTDRRFFQHRIRELIRQGVIEQVLVQNVKNKGANSLVKCFRLVSSDGSAETDALGGVIVQRVNDEDDDDEAEGEEEEDMGNVEETVGGVRTNFTIHSQITSFLEDKGTTGMTLNEISAALCHFDKRTVELLLSRAEKGIPPSHLVDLGIVAVTETYGRERRNRYYTRAAYRALVTEEDLSQVVTEQDTVDWDAVGGYAPLDSRLFYEDEAALFDHQDVYQIRERGDPSKPPAKRGRPRKKPLEEPANNTNNKTKKPASTRPGKRKLASGADEPPKRKGGRPPKKRRVDVDGNGGEVGRIHLALPGNQAPDAIDPNQPSIPTTIRASETDCPHTAFVTEGSLSSLPNTFREGGGINDSLHEAVNTPGGQTTVTNENESIPAFTARKRPTKVASPTVGNHDDHRPKKRQRVEPSSRLDSGETPPDKSGHQAIGDYQEPVAEIPAITPATFSRDADPPVVQEPDHNRSCGSTSLMPQNVPASQPSAVASDDRQNLELAEDDSSFATQNASQSDQQSSETPLAKAADGSSQTTPHRPNEDTIGDSGVPSGTSADRQTKAPHSKVNFSQLRRENEIFRVIENFGGITTLFTKEFFDAHMELIQSMAQADEATSSPVGTRLDKRTAAATVESMAARGRVKMLKTSLVTPTGISRPACIVYLPGAEQAKINDFLNNLGRKVQTPQPSAIKRIDEPMEFGDDGNRIPRSLLPLQLLQMDQPSDDPQERWSKNAAGATQLLSYDDATIRAVLLAEKTTIGQLYGFIVGKASRARQLHLAAIRALEERDPSPNVISVDHRIIHLSYLCMDLSASTYCTLISALNYDEELSNFLETEEGQQTPVRLLPPNIHSVLQVGRWRARSRFLDLLRILQFLKLTTPLQASDSDSPWITCPLGPDHPSKFDAVPLESWLPSNPSTAPLYWCFANQAPVYRWAMSEISPPLWKHLPLLSFSDASDYWRELQHACTGSGDGVVAGSSAPSDATDGWRRISRSLRRPSSWSEEYSLTWRQTQYLKRFIDLSTGNTPLENTLGDELQIQHISSTINAPQKAVRDFFAKAHLKVGRELNRAIRTTRARTRREKARKSVEAKARLSQKAAEAKNQRQKEWEDIVNRVHPEPLKGSAAARVRQVRARFLQSGSGGNVSKWEAAILESVKQAAIGAANFLKASGAAHFARTALARPEPPPVASNPPEKSIALLIEQQGPRLPPRSSDGKRVGRINDQEANSAEIGAKFVGTYRRHRFQWNRDYDELVRDASAVIKARCRNSQRLDWMALEQVFPAVPKNSVRQRLAHLRGTPGNEAYLNRLEDKWYELWIQHRGTDLLPDQDPQSPTNFDLIKHIEFLRNHVDKNALRVGFGSACERASAKMPKSIEELERGWEVTEGSFVSPSWDFMWNAVVEEGREKQLLQQAFTTHLEEIPAPAPTLSDSIYVAESALKMVIGTPTEGYECENASRLLCSVGNGAVSAARADLLSRGILSKTVRDPKKSRPGRDLKISEMNQNALGGSIPRDIFLDAVSLEDIFTHQEDIWQEWSLLASEGDTAALFQLVSDDKVEFKVDTSQAQVSRTALDWNSKKADDDHIETTVHVRYRQASDSAVQPSNGRSSPDIPGVEFGDEPLIGHGETAGGDPACCRLSSLGLVDCAACLKNEMSSFIAGLADRDQALAGRILAAVSQAGSTGITKHQLLEKMSDPAVQTFDLGLRMIELPVPLLFWAGYSVPVLVSSAHLREWTVTISESPRTMIFPRRWFDISGSKMVDVWEAALKAVVGVIKFRPGVSQAELRWRLRSVYDRQEVNEVLNYLQEEGVIELRLSPSSQLADQGNYNIALMPDDNEERSRFWLIRESRHWYQV